MYWLFVISKTTERQKVFNLFHSLTSDQRIRFFLIKSTACLFKFREFNIKGVQKSLQEQRTVNLANRPIFYIWEGTRIVNSGNPYTMERLTMLPNVAQREIWRLKIKVWRTTCCSVLKVLKSVFNYDSGALQFLRHLVSCVV